MAETMNKSYELRRLCADDIFPFCTIINQIGFVEIKNCFDKPEIKDMLKGKNKDAETVGITIAMDIVGIIIANIEKCKTSLYQLLSQISGMSVDDIGSLDMSVFIEMIIDIVKKEEFNDFFKVASRLFK